MTTLRVDPANAPLRGSIPAAPDAATATIALVVMALAKSGTSARLNTRGMPQLTAVKALAELGVEVEQNRDGCRLTSAGLLLQKPAGPLRAGRSVATAAAIAGVLAAQRFESQLEIDAPPSSLLPNLVRPLRARGAVVEGQLLPNHPGQVLSPLRFKCPPGGGLSPLQYQPPPRDWAGKTTSFISGMFADGPTLIQESVVSHERCERLLSELGMPIASAGPFVEFDGQSWDGTLPPLDSAVPGSSESAAMLLGAAALVPESLVTVRDVAYSGGCRGYLDALQSAAATLAVSAKPSCLGEGTADLTLRGNGSVGLTLRGELSARAGASTAAQCLFAVAANRGCSSAIELLRANEPLRQMLRAFGLRVEPQGAELAIAGAAGEQLRACQLDAHNDADLAMAATALALRADGPCEIRGAGAIVETFPRFVASLRALGAQIDVKRDE